VLLSSRTRKADWADWKKQVGVPRLKPAGTLQFDHCTSCCRRRWTAWGLALGPVTLVAHDLASGRLCCPLPALRLALNRHHYGVAPGAAPEAQIFAQWLEGERGRDARR